MKRADAATAHILSDALDRIDHVAKVLTAPYRKDADGVVRQLRLGLKVEGNAFGTQGPELAVDAETGRILLTLARNLIADRLKALGVEL